MKTFVFTYVFICVFFTGYSQAKNYKNQINKNVKDNVLIEKKVEIKEKKPSNINKSLLRKSIKMLKEKWKK